MNFQRPADAKEGEIPKLPYRSKRTTTLTESWPKTKVVTFVSHKFPVYHLASRRG